MNEVITLETMPKAMAYLITKVEALEKAIAQKDKVHNIHVDHWFNIDELADYLPDRPARATVYGWVSRKEIPYHKGGKRLRFLQSEIDTWLSSGKRTSKKELEAKAESYCVAKKVSK
ncbi:helix-turn-helix domain-containing protein [Bacteroides graminisolvens]|jgi:excisionase family DNA binding protein|uniref:helix-turn-helix domain-containing protein n=1 Tax=Bacteroides graminisolvens TaxID=477666 RepID=UPI0029C6C579|nr:helix-turn-helix domain-containing protein [Bacteroides graminisolvens]